eukprot:gnl/TRDRNA2_/TRDRNA2_134304_c1_seq1.p1 gnl/TRDRNA2_/TRDRNA2_134304_c1~~gnl/TRDRNA2_/TRDRNA2_134304_c1_seq1.p1  ORF type:complete len:552 (+),score=105.68 gnl/TRDRNA2_/TRDRNA2_134304_c1_seq1:143-1798(+)
MRLRINCVMEDVCEGRGDEDPLPERSGAHVTLPGCTLSRQAGCGLGLLQIGGQRRRIEEPEEDLNIDSDELDDGQEEQASYRSSRREENEDDLGHEEEEKESYHPSRHRKPKRRAMWRRPRRGYHEAHEHSSQIQHHSRGRIKRGHPRRNLTTEEGGRLIPLIYHLATPAALVSDAMMLTSSVTGSGHAEIPRGMALLLGILLGILLSAVLIAFGVCARKKAQSTAEVQMEAGNGTIGQPELVLAAGNMDLAHVRYLGASFWQFHWSLEAAVGTGRGDYDRDGLWVLDANFRKLAFASGRLMATPNGEMHLRSNGVSWAILKRPAPSRRPGQLWDFKVCSSNGEPYAEVRQRSETKCVVVDPHRAQHRMMTVIRNFTYPVFLSGERNIHVWTQQDQLHPQAGLCAQCEARELQPDAQGALGNLSSEEQEDRWQQGEACRFHVSTTATTDASLVMAVLLGLQEVQRMAHRGRRSSMAGQGVPAEEDEQQPLQEGSEVPSSVRMPPPQEQQLQQADMPPPPAAAKAAAVPPDIAELALNGNHARTSTGPAEAG